MILGYVYLSLVHYAHIVADLENHNSLYVYPSKCQTSELSGSHKNFNKYF
jgi:hypothetical protein